MDFQPFVDRCTTFKNVRILTFPSESVEITIHSPEGGRKVFINTKAFDIYYNTNTLKIMNILQEVKLKSVQEAKSRIKRIKLHSNLEDLIINSNIETLLKEYLRSSKAMG